MLRRGDRVAVAVSGGKDSLALLKILHGSAERLGVELVVISVDEGVAGYREEAISHAKSLTSELKLEHTTVSYQELFGFTLDQALNWKDERDVSSCSFCGVFRRRAIDEAATRTGASVVATAHNLDDFVQTFMLNLLHGDVTRMGWLHPAHTGEGFPLRRVKPFMEVYEEEIALYSYGSGIPFQSVSCPYMHEGLRTEVRDFLNEMEAKHAGMKNVLLSSSVLVASRLSSLERGSGSIPCSICGKPSSKGICNVCTMKKLVLEHSKSVPAPTGIQR